jgi:hypothetical protein
VASSSVEESERICTGISSVLKMSSGSRLRLKSKKVESRDFNQDQEKGMRREDYCRMVRFFDGGLFSSHGDFPLSAMALGVFWRRRMRRSEMMEVCTSGFAEHRMAILLAMEIHQE